MSETVTLFEHEYTEGFRWTDREYAALEQVNRAAGAEILRATVRAGGARELRAAQHVGVVRFAGRTVQVLPKIYRSGVVTPAERVHEATRNLLHLLAYAGRLPVREHALAPLARQGDDWFEILTRLFATHLLEEWQRGAHRRYQTIEDELPVLKGKWRVAESLRRPARAHVFPVAFDEFTADNALNRIFRFVTERLWRLTRDADNRRTLGDLRQWMEEVMLPAHVNAGEAAPAALLTRLNARYEPLLNLARLFLEGGSLRLASEDFETFAFVFDMNKLFESFVFNFIRRHRERILPPALHTCDLLPQSHGAPHYLARNERGVRVFQLHPDIAFRRGTNFPLLLDTKYKRLKPTDAKLGISSADFYQMHAYAHRYNCPRVVLLYPQTAGMAKPEFRPFVLEGGGATIEAATVDLRIDLSGGRGRDTLIKELKNIMGGNHDERERCDV